MLIVLFSLQNIFKTFLEIRSLMLLLFCIIGLDQLAYSNLKYDLMVHLL